MLLKMASMPYVVRRPSHTFWQNLKKILPIADTETWIASKPFIVTKMYFTWKDAPDNCALFHKKNYSVRWTVLEYFTFPSMSTWKYHLVTMNGLKVIHVSASTIDSGNIFFEFWQNVCEGLLTTYGIDAIFNNIWVLSTCLCRSTYNIWRQTPRAGPSRVFWPKFWIN